MSQLISWEKISRNKNLGIPFDSPPNMKCLSCGDKRETAAFLFKLNMIKYNYICLVGGKILWQHH
jgi:hypothetical protein